MARRILDVITDVLTLLALAIAGVGHFLPWFEEYTDRYQERHYDYEREELGVEQIGEEVAEKEAAGDDREEHVLPIDFQMWHAVRSGIALALAAILVGASLTLDLGVGTRKLLVFLMFVTMLAAIGFQVMICTPYPITEAHRQFASVHWRELDGHLAALIPSVIAGALCLVRMGWTMTASSKPNGPSVAREPLRDI